MVLLNTIVIIHDIPLINNPVIIEPRQIFFFFSPPHSFKDSRSVSWQENVLKGEKLKGERANSSISLPPHQQASLNV